MNATNSLPHALPERLIHAQTGAVIGYRVVGVGAGPLALATGRRRDAEKAFWRLATHNSLPRLRGELFMMFDDAIDDQSAGEEVNALMARTYDGSVYISFQDARGAIRAAQDRDAYWSVLRLCTRLGMISGRGIPAFALSMLSCIEHKPVVYSWFQVPMSA